MLDYLLDAMNEISDEHIAEAVTYEPKIKVISWKKITAVAACLLVVAVSALAISNTNEPPVTSSMSTAYATTVAGTITTTTTAGTTIAYAPVPTDKNNQTTVDSSTTHAEVSTTHSCVLQEKWQDRSLYYTTPSFNFEGRKYICTATSYYVHKFVSEKIKGVLKEEKMLGYAEGYEKIPVDVLICEINGVDKENAVVVSRKDGLQGGYCFYIENSLISTKNFNELLTNLNYKENLVLTDPFAIYPQNGGEPEIRIDYYKHDVIAYFKENVLNYYEGATDTIECKGDEQETINEAFIEILERNMEKAESLSGEDIEIYQYFSEDCLEFEGFICGYDFTVRFTEQGKLYFMTSEGITCYNLTKDDFKSFLSLVQSEAQ